VARCIRGLLPYSLCYVLQSGACAVPLGRPCRLKLGAVVDWVLGPFAGQGPLTTLWWSPLSRLPPPTTLCWLPLPRLPLPKPNSLIVLFTTLSRAPVGVGVLGKCAECAFSFFSTYGAFRSVSDFGGASGS
jgi:hypothetical protein